MSRLKGSDPAVTRLILLTVRLLSGRMVDAPYITRTYGVALATAKRDLLKLECTLPVERVKGKMVIERPTMLRLLCAQAA